jgi:hypothetical protein
MEGTTMEGIIPSLYQGQYVVNSIFFLKKIPPHKKEFI